MVTDTITRLEWQRDGSGTRTGCRGSDNLTRQRVGEAVSEVQAGRVSAAAEAPVPGPGQLGMLRRDRNHFHARLANQQIQFAPTCLAEAALDDNRSLDKACR